MDDAQSGAAGVSGNDGAGGRAPRRISEEAQGDGVCWLPRVCTECGALVEGALPADCWRCGAEVGGENHD
ncbi:hypothetical protein FFT87_06005 [Salinibacterium sp. M195]|nr:hypothetical protein FFT87_06005 [Salinibacterium sp. M195]